MKYGSAPRKVDLNPEEILQKLAKKLLALRKNAGYSNADFFAYENQIHRSQYGRYENGSDLKFTTLVKIINAHGLTLKEFFSEGFE